MATSRGFALRALLLSSLMVPALAAAQQRQEPRLTMLPAVRANPPAVYRDSVVRLARQQLGRRYVFGGESPTRGFDCSGFLKYLMRAFDVDMPRTAAEQARVGRPIPRERSLLRPGDILTFGERGRVTHVGMYVGNGRYVHASSGAGRIVESDLDRPQSRLVRAWYGVRRLFGADEDSSASVAVRREPAPPVRRAPAAPQVRRARG
ncbi:MAG TPA: C40 family peptidase [Longimicrobium sp.]|nr:C40 family peptidase [Longimicrobium sp.]